ncbi:MAG: B12-binding domain-containing radical SAM protein [Deltaproteobacteria bacterium]|nr:B12-binding domain-containing radical SAM protein [Deltaproteobacteria bacterium]
MHNSISMDNIPIIQPADASKAFRSPKDDSSVPLRFVLVNPTRTGGDSYITPPLHLVYVASAICEAGHDVSIIDLHYEFQNSINSWGSVEEFERVRFSSLADEPMDFLGIGGIPSSYHCARDLVQLFKARRPEVPIIVGGNMSMPLLSYWHKLGVDYVVESDGELPIKEFCQFWPDNSRVSKIPGVHHWQPAGYTKTIASYNKSLDHIGFPKWDLLPNIDDYLAIFRHWTNRILPKDLQLGPNDRMIPIVMTRGCPYECTFCYHVTRRYRKHSVEYVIEYLKRMKSRYGITHVFTWDDLIMVDRNWLSDLCDALITEDLGIKIFTSGGKPDLVTREVLKKMRAAGFLRVSYGIESGSQEILDEMKKKTTVAQNRDSVLMATEEGLFVHLNMIVGMPGESLRTLMETARFLIGLAKRGVVSGRNLSFSYATGYPGTELYDEMMKRGLVTDTESYLKNQAGLGNYKYNLCGIPQRVIKLIINLTFLRVNLSYHLFHRQISSALKGFMFDLSKALAAFVLPAKVLVALRHLVLRRQILQEESDSVPTVAC